MLGKMNYFRILVALLILSVFSTTCLSGTTIRKDSILLNESISDGQTLVSMKEIFVLGFFSPGISSYRYVGTWYNNFPNRTVVWVANRNQPVLDASGILRFDNSGNLIISDERGSSFIVAYGSGAKDMEAAILDTGNLVLRSIVDTLEVTWQSFDFPTDTWLPGMKIGIGGSTNQSLSSWRSSVDPTMGDYSLGLDPRGMLQNYTQLFIRWKGNTFWTGGRWNGDMFSLIPELRSFANMNIPVSFQCTIDNDMSCTYIANPSDRMTRIVIDPRGSLSIMQFDPQAQLWILLWRQPSGCEVSKLCGAFSICNENMLPKCRCTTGFAPRDVVAYDNGYTRGGCTRKIGLQCNSDKFLEMPNVQLPDHSDKLSLMAHGECESACSMNCSCIAYAHSLLDGCSLWYGELMNLQDNYHGNGVETLYLRLAKSELESRVTSGGKMHWIAGVVSSVAFLIFSSLLLLFWIRRQNHKGKGKLRDQRSVLPLDTDSGIKLWESKETCSHFMLFSFSQIANATDNLAPENKLGEGGFGPVYKGNLEDRQDIAVKRLAANSGQGLLEFKNEILLIAKLQHTNLVRLLGCCIEREEKMLIYEYMPNKSLDFFLFEQSRRMMLDWAMRINIIEGIAQGLLYLHKHSRLRIIHRDLKASNILLDIDMNPKISDFGMARIFGSQETQANTNRVVGTYGYMAPEYAMEGIFSVKSDVFSFGVLLLEIISGIRNAGFHQRGNTINLLGYAWELWRKGRWSELIDSSVGEACPEHKVSRCIHVGLMCVQQNAVDRPNMAEVISMLTNESFALPDPKQPAFLSVGLPTETELHGVIQSLNDLTISKLHGR